MAHQKILKNFPHPPHIQQEFDYLIAIATLKRKGDKGLDNLKNYLTEKSLEVNSNSAPLDVLRHLLLLKLGEEPIFVTPICKEIAWTRISPNEVILKNRARAKKLKEERKAVKKKKTE